MDPGGASMNHYPNDDALVERVLTELKSKGLYDRLRKDFVADADTKPAYQNLRQRLQRTVSDFLAYKAWRPDMNKNKIRESVRKHVLDKRFLDNGVDYIVNQVINPKIYPTFIPQVEDVVCNLLGIEKPATGDSSSDAHRSSSSGGLLPYNMFDNQNDFKETAREDLLPRDLDPISPENDETGITIKKEDSESSTSATMDKFESASLKGEMSSEKIRRFGSIEETLKIEMEDSTSQLPSIPVAPEPDDVSMSAESITVHEDADMGEDVFEDDDDDDDNDNMILAQMSPCGPIHSDDESFMMERLDSSSSEDKLLIHLPADIQEKESDENSVEQEKEEQEQTLQEELLKQEEKKIDSEKQKVEDKKRDDKRKDEGKRDSDRSSRRDKERGSDSKSQRSSESSSRRNYKDGEKSSKGSSRDKYDSKSQSSKSSDHKHHSRDKDKPSERGQSSSSSKDRSYHRQQSSESRGDSKSSSTRHHGDSRRERDRRHDEKRDKSSDKPKSSDSSKSDHHRRHDSSSSSKRHDKDNHRDKHKSSDRDRSSSHATGSSLRQEKRDSSKSSSRTEEKSKESEGSSSSRDTSSSKSEDKDRKHTQQQDSAHKGASTDEMLDNVSTSSPDTTQDSDALKSMPFKPKFASSMAEIKKVMRMRKEYDRLNKKTKLHDAEEVTVTEPAVQSEVAQKKVSSGDVETIEKEKTVQMPSSQTISETPFEPKSTTEETQQKSEAELTHFDLELAELADLEEFESIVTKYEDNLSDLSCDSPRNEDLSDFDDDVYEMDLEEEDAIAFSALSVQEKGTLDVIPKNEIDLPDSGAGNEVKSPDVKKGLKIGCKRKQTLKNLACDDQLMPPAEKRSISLVPKSPQSTSDHIDDMESDDSGSEKRATKSVRIKRVNGIPEAPSVPSPSTLFVGDTPDSLLESTEPTVQGALGRTSSCSPLPWTPETPTAPKAGRGRPSRAQRNAKQQQRYDSSDLYKPRLSFSSKRGREPAESAEVFIDTPKEVQVKRPRGRPRIK